MIKIKFSELKINDEFFALSDKEGYLPMNKVSKNSFYCLGNETKTEDCDVLISPKFKDRYGKDLSVGDRILYTKSDDTEEDVYTGLIDDVIRDIKISKYDDHYTITFNEGSIDDYIYNKDIVKIESNWGI